MFIHYITLRYYIHTLHVHVIHVIMTNYIFSLIFWMVVVLAVRFLLTLMRFFYPPIVSRYDLTGTLWIVFYKFGIHFLLLF